MMPRDPRRSSQAGSIQAAAERIRRILEREERERAATQRVASAEPTSKDDADFLKAKFPVGSTGWGAQRIRRILDREERATPTADMPSTQLAESETAHDSGYGYPDLAWDVARHALRGEADILDAIETEYKGYVGARAALSEMVGSQLPGRERGPADAYRHILLAAELTRRFGKDRAREFLNLHEREGNLRGQPTDEYEMDLNNNEIGMRIGAFARDFNDAISAARKVISGSAADGGGAWKPNYDPTSTLAPRAARWLPEQQWSNNPKFDQPPPQSAMSSEQAAEMPTDQTNWYTNPNRANGPDWVGGYVPDAYRYPYGSSQHATGPQDPMGRHAAGAYRFYVEDPLLQWLRKMRDGR